MRALVARGVVVRLKMNMKRLVLTLDFVLFTSAGPKKKDEDVKSYFVLNPSRTSSIKKWKEVPRVVQI